MSVEAMQTGSQEFKLMSGPTHQMQPYKPLQYGNNISRGCLVILQSPLMFQLTTAKATQMKDDVTRLHGSYVTEACSLCLVSVPRDFVGLCYLN